jgi:predicted TIM-barrel fold metal-dependent hydrolase
MTYDRHMSQPFPVIDMWAPFVPSREIIAHAADRFPEPQLGYLQLFFKQSNPTTELFGTLARAMVTDDDAIIDTLDKADITRTLITGFNEASTGGTHFVSNKSVAAIAERHPDRFIPFCGADITEGATAVRDVDYWITERSFAGLSLRPFMIGLPADHRLYYPFYAKCVELNVPVSIHASANWTTCRPSDLGHPRHFDQVACDFPDLKLILSHAGYPWVLEACLLAWKHPNVYLELAAHRPKYFSVPEAGWGPLLRYGQTTIQDKILYGTGAFLIGASPAELVNEMRQLQLRPGILQKWMHDNAAALLASCGRP